MAKISYTSLKLKINKNIKTINFNGVEIEVLEYLPISDKYDLVMTTLQKSVDNNIYNPLKVDMYFHLNLIYLYTNISFTEKQREDEEKLYDSFKSTGLLDEILKVIDENEYNELYNYIQEVLIDNMEYKTSIISILSDVINNLPEQAAAAMEIVENFDKDKFSEVVDFAKALNGNRNI